MVMLRWQVPRGPRPRGPAAPRLRSFAPAACPRRARGTAARRGNADAMAKGKGRIFIKLVSTAGTGFFYTAKKNPRTMTRKLALRKYDPVVNRHVLFTEQKHK